MEGKMKVSFLFGAGTSIPAGIPSTKDITDSIILGKDIRDGLEFFRHSDDHFYKKPDNSFEMAYGKNMVSNITKFLSRIVPEVEYFLGTRGFERPANYEDLFFIVSQFDHHYNEEGLNPAIQPFIDKISHDTKYLMKMEFSKERYSLAGFSREAAKYINDIAIHMIKSPVQNTNHLSFLKEIDTDSEITRADIFSLNYDLVIEKYFNDNLLFLNNFMEPTSDSRIMSWNEKNSLQKFNLLKLHGSVDWYFKDGVKAMPVMENIDFNTLNMTDLFDYHRPVLLMGTLNKVLKYSTDTWIDLQWMFKNMLSESDFLIISGYGFGDEMVNSRIMSWLNFGKERKIILVHAEPEKIRSIDLSMFYDELGWSRWTSLRKEGKIILVRKWIQNIKWKEIKEIIKEHTCQNKNLN